MILGHDQPLAQLRAAIAGNTLAPTYIFAGPSGVGKSLVARWFAQTLVGRESENHPDIIWVTPPPDKILGGIEIDQIRRMQSLLNLHALEGGRKIAILDPADSMNDNAANSCLKILEEPPPLTHFILISSRMDRLLPTIRSRSQVIHFGALNEQLIVRQLIASGLDPAEARQRAILADGSLGHALQYPADVIAETATDLHALLTQPDANTTLAAAERWSADATQLPWRLQLIGLLWRDALAKQCGCERAPWLPGTASLIAQLRQRPAARLSRELTHTLQSIDLACAPGLNKQLCCEALLFNLSQT